MSTFKPFFKTTDGRTHESQERAEKHQAIVDASKEFEAAALNVRKALLSSALTADGKPMEMRSATYYYVRESFYGMPAIEELYVWPYRAEIDQDRNGEIIFRCEHRDGKTRKYPINRLFLSKRSAERELLRVSVEQLAKFTAEVESLRQRIEEVPA